ncbi:collagenase-like [Scaptodrosophila lebanonensis]|uniref:Collagenase-like n=1 Tax=Drosophila lebanonensis TaxID=7225 RepID=A0A6J2UEQ3_DROLE|nr:collagenase-like [Scaptodrosophila lebanonensis]
MSAALSYLFEFIFYFKPNIRSIINGKEAETEQFPYQVFFDVEHNGERSERSPVLRYTYGSTLTNNECKTSVLQAMSKNAVDNDFIFSPTLICLAASESNPCYGESGGPLVLNEQTEQSTIIGIASRATHPFCAPGNPVLYTRVSAYLDWIKENSYR